MAISLYDASVSNYLQTLGGLAGVLDKGEQHAGDGGLDLGEIVDYKLRDDMLPFSFQVISAWHHSLGAIKGLKEGLFTPPPSLGALDYGQLQGLVAEAIAGLQAETPEEINTLADKPITFKLAEMEIPFTAENFILSFSLPNFYFHTTTAYDALRINGVPLGKMDFLGQLRVGA
jgi:hypothetical protein